MPDNDDDLYSQRDMPPDKPSRSRDSDDDNDEEDEQKTALIPKSIFGGHKCKVGDIKRFKVEAIYDDEYEISYVGKDDKDKEDDSNETRDSSERELDSMATDY